MEWFRASELSCDRAAALVTRDPLTVCRTLMVIAAGAEAERLDLDVFMRQGARLPREGLGLERLSRLLLDLNITHPMPVRRVHELMEWVKSGDYDRIVGGEYVTRDVPPDAARRGRATRSPTTPSASARCSATPVSRSATSGKQLERLAAPRTRRRGR